MQETEDLIEVKGNILGWKLCSRSTRQPVNIRASERETLREFYTDKYKEK